MPLPDGYTVLSESGDTIIVGVVNFLLQGEKSPPFVKYQNKKYKRGPMDVIPNHLAGKICSCREYYLIKTKVLMTVPDNLVFSQRNKLEKIIRKWMEENSCSDCPLNTISFLQQNGLLNTDKTKEFIEKEKV